jgi:hypothetical protein
MTRPLPRLNTALADVLAEALMHTPDGWARAELPLDWPFTEIGSSVGNRIPDLRVGVLRPFRAEQFANIDSPVSDNPSEITRWRNTRDRPTLVLGDATGREEAGLRAAPRVVKARDVLNRWERELAEWVEAQIPAEPPGPFVRSLFEICSEGMIDATRLDEYVGATLSNEGDILARLRSELWRLNLFPDQRVLDTGVAQSRLSLNLQTRQLLLSASDAPSDLKRLRRIQEAATAQRSSAQRALNYRSRRDRNDLQGIDLDEIIDIMSSRSAPRPPQRRPLDLLDFLNSASGSQEAAESVLADLSGAWDLQAVDSVRLVASFALPDESSRDVQVPVEPKPREGSPWVGDGRPESQIVSFLARRDAEHDWLPAPGEAVSAQRLLAVAAAQDQITGERAFEALATEYIAARANLGPYERWLRRSAFPLLLLKPQARDAVRSHLDAWQALVDAAARLEPGEAGVIRNSLVLLEAVWGKETRTDGHTVYDWCVLGPCHPYVLDPLLRLADYGLASLGAAELGTKVAWALDRSLPAYRVIWGPGTSLFLAKREELFDFGQFPAGDRPAVSSGDGMYQVARSFIGFHPFANDALVITLIDAPKGGAVAKNLRRLEREVRDLRVFLVTTSGESAQLGEAGDPVGNLGRFASVADWLERAPARSHLVFYFAERPPGTAVAAQSGWGPTPGTHIALRIRVEAPVPFEERLVPFVAFEPRESNSPVVAIQRLAAPSFGAPRLFEVQPMLQENQARQLTALSEVADWVVIGAPAPLGLVAPRHLGGRITYLGREALGLYGLFVYATSLFPIRKLLTQGMRPAPVLPNPEEVERQLTALAVESPNGVLRIGRSRGAAMWEQIGIIASSEFGRSLRT